jgi:subtilisin family serine protease
MDALELVRLTPLMELSSGRPEIAVGLIDGPVWMDRSGLWSAKVERLGADLPATCTRPNSSACTHGTFVAGILAARRGSQAPAICPGCTLLVRAVFSEETKSAAGMPSAMPTELAQAILDVVGAGARVINLSLSVLATSTRDQRQLEAALNYAAGRGVIVVAAAGNQGEVGSSPLTRHSWPIPVAGADSQGQPTPTSNLGRSIGQRGLRAPSENIASLGPSGQIETFSGTSAAAPFVTGAIALLWSEFPRASASAIRLAVTGTNRSARRAVVPPLLDAWAAYQSLGAISSGRKPS